MHGFTRRGATLPDFNNNLLKKVKIAVYHTTTSCTRMKIGRAQGTAAESADVILQQTMRANPVRCQGTCQHL